MNHRHFTACLHARLTACTSITSPPYPPSLLVTHLSIVHSPTLLSQTFSPAPLYVSRGQVSLVSQPDFSYNLSVQGGDITFLPGLEAFINSFVRDLVLRPYVLPEGFRLAIDGSIGRVEVTQRSARFCPLAPARFPARSVVLSLACLTVCSPLACV